MKKCYYKPTRKKPRKWTMKDLARVAGYLVRQGKDEGAVIMEIFAQPEFKQDDIIRALEPQSSLIHTFRTIRRFVKFLILLFAAIEIMTAGAAVVFLLPLQAELVLLLVGIGAYVAELKRLKRYVREVHKLVGFGPQGDPLGLDVPSEDELEEAAKEADNLAGKVNSILDSLDVITD